MAGGRWTSQNKKQPGFYINFNSTPTTLSEIGDRGIVAIARNLNWGPFGELITITSIADVYNKLGYDINDESMLFAQQIFRGSTSGYTGAERIYVYRLDESATSAKATATVEGLTVTALYAGTRGNDITIILTPDLDTAYTTEEDPDTELYAVYTVNTIVDGAPVDSQIVGSYVDAIDYIPATIGDLVSNNWVVFSGTATDLLTASAGLPLTGGVDGDVTTTAYSNFLTTLEPVLFNIVIYDGTSQTIKTSFANFVDRVTTQTGRHSQCVLSGYPSADNECVISVKNGFILNTEREFPLNEATWWVGGVEAGAANFQSLTYAKHPDAVEALPRLTSDELDEAQAEGSIAFIEEFGSVKIMSDINTFTTFLPDKGSVFSKNQTIRVCWGLANDLYFTFSEYYIGKQRNTIDGRNAFKAEVVAYCNQLAGLGAIENFTVDDVEVLPGNDVDSIVINLTLYIAFAVEKIYMTVTVSSDVATVALNTQVA